MDLPILHRYYYNLSFQLESNDVSVNVCCQICMNDAIPLCPFTFMSSHDINKLAEFKSSSYKSSTALKTIVGLSMNSA